MRLDTDLFQFSWISRNSCQEGLGKLSNEQFTDFCLLLGSPFLQTFPPFENPSFPGKGPIIRDAVSMFHNAGRSALALCSQFGERVKDGQRSLPLPQ